MNKIVIIIGAVLLLGIGFIVLTGNSNDTTVTGSSITGNVISASSEESRYAQLEAEFACNLLETSDETNEKAFEDIMAVLQGFQDLADKHGFTLKEVETLKDKYANDHDFANLVVEIMLDTCPTKASEFNLKEIVQARG